jgi:hypothetical protein
LSRFTDFAADDEERVVGTGGDRLLVCAPQMVPLYALVRVRGVRRIGLDRQELHRWLHRRLVAPTDLRDGAPVRKPPHFEPQRWPLLADHLGAHVGQWRHSLGRERPAGQPLPRPGDPVGVERERVRGR